MSKINRCPCGQIPTKLLVSADCYKAKYAMASGNCCSEWLIEFRNDYLDISSDESQAKALTAWNNSPRIRRMI